MILQAVEIATAVALGLPALVREGMSWSDVRLRALSAAPVRLQPQSRSQEGVREGAVGWGSGGPARPASGIRSLSLRKTIQSG